MITKFTSKEAVMKLAANCSNCGSCCRFGSGFVLPAEISKIAEYLNISRDEFKKKYIDEEVLFNKKIYKFKAISRKKPYGPCTFLKNNNCEIHDVKPLHCKVANCNEHGEDMNEWFIVNYIIDPEDPVSVREWASRLQSKPTIPGGKPHELVPDAKKLNRILNYDIMR